MNCFYHPNQEAIGTCKSCGKGLCAACATDLGKGLACRNRCEADAQAMILAGANRIGTSAGVAIVGNPGRGPQVEVPIQVGGDGFGLAETLRPEDGPAIAVGVNGLELADAPAADEFAGAPEFAVVFAGC